jgi:hypothetical protein
VPVHGQEQDYLARPAGVLDPPGRRTQRGRAAVDRPAQGLSPARIARQVEPEARRVARQRLGERHDEELLLAGGLQLPDLEAQHAVPMAALLQGRHVGAAHRLHEAVGAQPAVLLGQVPVLEVGAELEGVDVPAGGEQSLQRP